MIIIGGIKRESQRPLAEMVTRPDSLIDARISPTFYDLLTPGRAEPYRLRADAILNQHGSRVNGAKGLMTARVLPCRRPRCCPCGSTAHQGLTHGVPMLEVPVKSCNKSGVVPFHVVGLNQRLEPSPGGPPAL